MSKPKTLVERMRLLFSTSNGADIHFLLIPAHKTILASASDVFEAMFRFDAGNTGRKASTAKVPSPVVVPDVEAEAFRAMLGFIYTDDLSGMDGDNLFDVLYAAKKYNIVGLVNACLDFPIPSLPNVFFAFAQARFLEEKVGVFLFSR
ncbi:hypothetical protein niasHT_030325 [Heterodera trifolii]|uniref:BTB domain-containing protein n=1 Tax=Heterodera trifolii TaxID=157864 RepID=A0ABD2KR78_9BILA